MVRSGSVGDSTAIEVETNPVTSLTLQASADAARTGDVVVFAATAKDARGVGGAWCAGAVCRRWGNSVADHRGWRRRDDYYRRPVCGRAFRNLHRGGDVPVATRQAGSFRYDPGMSGRRSKWSAAGPVLDRHTSDLWVWEGTDGRDYAIAGTWGSDGSTYIWDVTTPADIQKINEIQVDARTVNDVKVSEDGDIAVISREGASDRKNGIVVLVSGIHVRAFPCWRSTRTS